MKAIVSFCMTVSMCLGLVNVAFVTTASAETTKQNQAVRQLVEIQQLHQAILREIQGYIESQAMKVDVQVLFPKTAIEVPQGQLVLEVQKDRFSHLTGRRGFRIEMLVDSQPIKTVSVVASVTVQVEVMTPVRWVKIHEVLKSKDLVKTTVNLQTLNQDILIHPDDIIGKQATRSLPPHQPLGSSFVAEPPLVHKGDRVMIEVRRGGLFVQTLGVAKASGQSGELITVTNQTSGRDILAMVRSEGVVEVRF